MNVLRAFLRRPARPPPPAPDTAIAGHDRLKAWCLHLRGLALRLAGLAQVPPARAALLREYVADLDSTLGAHPLNFDLRLYIDRGESDVLRPLLAELRGLTAPDASFRAAMEAAEQALLARALVLRAGTADPQTAPPAHFENRHPAGMPEVRKVPPSP